MIKKLLILLVLFTPVTAFCQPEDDEILMRIHDRDISLSEFERIYNKNNTNPSIEQQTVTEYLELFINFKLKVIEAEELGLDTTEAFKREFNGYKKQLAKPYLSDKEEMDELVKEAFERAQYDLNVSHILIRCDQFASPDDTAKAWQKTIEIRERILGGEDFGTVAKATSDDPSVKDNAGELGYFTTFRMLYPFESGAYNTETGEISMPVRTRFGYHLIRINDKRPAKGTVKVAHIMVLTPQGMSEKDLKAAEEKIFLYYDKIQLGMDFTEMAQKYSEDRGSAARGGELPVFGTGRMVPEFENASFALEKPGEISKPVKTSFGWHIIKLIEKTGVDDFEASKEEIKAMVTKSDRNSYSKKAMVSKIKKQYQFMEYRGRLADFYSVVDSTIFDRTWTAEKAAHLDEILFVIGDREIPQSDFAIILENGQATSRMNIIAYINNKYDEFVENKVIEYEEDQLVYKFPDYRYLLQEYHDGILLFDLTDQMVWSKAIQDTIGLLAFYEENKNNYSWDKRMDATLYTCRDESVANKARELLIKKMKKATPDELAGKLFGIFKDSTCVEFSKGIYEPGDNEFMDQMNWNNPFSDNIQSGDKIILIQKNKIIRPEPKELNESRGLVTADYQTHLEKLWIEELKAKYAIKVNEDLLSKVE
ncbi:MAG: peptidylprolyl isomerase [Bacteroidales bacterium]|nr:peptidylprolyl isomerase [Bacteroidales bacterium]